MKYNKSVNDTCSFVLHLRFWFYIILWLRLQICINCYNLAQNFIYSSYAYFINISIIKRQLLQHNHVVDALRMNKILFTFWIISINFLRHAGIFTAEEVIYITREKLIRLQSLYIDQFRRLQYVLREKRRKYLLALKKEKETLCTYIK